LVDDSYDGDGVHALHETKITQLLAVPVPVHNTLLAGKVFVPARYILFMIGVSIFLKGNLLQGYANGTYPQYPIATR
jgi:hypothetical protein